MRNTILKSSNIALLCVLICCISSSLMGQNLLRNPSFEEGSKNKPTNLNELNGFCSHWKRHDDSHNGGYKDTPDWFEATPGKMRGSISCGLVGQTSQNAGPFVPPDDGSHFAGIIKEHDFQEGEGIQQKLQHKLDFGYYTLDFDYLIPCDTFSYGYKIVLGKQRNHLDLVAKELNLPTANIGQWQHETCRFFIPNEWDKKFDWFIFLSRGNSSPVYQTSRLGAYLFIDNFHLTQSPCTDCDPTGLISWNNNSMRPYMTPNNDGVFDNWCMTNINNVSWYEFDVFDRWGSNVYSEAISDPNGFENLSLCWDGKNQSGQLLNIPNEYQVRVRLGNCGTQLTQLFQVFTSNDLAHDAYSIAPNYVPPLFGLNSPPTHFKNLDLYGGIYFGNHDWYACDSIFIGGSGEPRVPYFVAGSTSNLGFYSTAGTFIDIGDTDFHPGSDIDINPQNVTCCLPLRHGNPDSFVPQEADSISDSEMEQLDERWLGDAELQLQSSDPFRLNVFPIPVKELLKIEFYLSSGGNVSINLVNSDGAFVLNILNPTKYPSGKYDHSISVKTLPSGVYILRFKLDNELILRKVVIQN